MRALPLALVALLGVAASARAQVVLDDSLGNNGEAVGSGFYVEGDPSTFTDHLIHEGLGGRSGSNLFFSFSEFNLITPAGADPVSATFTADAPADHVIARVTGGSESLLNGVLRSTVEGADLFFLNPSGVVLGSDARLDVRGAFHVSTAGALRFSDGHDFFTAAAVDSVLSSALPRAFGFLSDAPSGIRVETPINSFFEPLQVPAGETLSVVGGDLEINGAGSKVTLRSIGGRLQLASVASAIDVPIDVATLDPAGLPAGALGEISVAGARLDVNRGFGFLGQPEESGTIVIRGGRFAMAGGRLTADTKGTLGATPASAIDIRAQDEVALRDGALLRSRVFASDTGGSVHLEAERLEIEGSGTQVEVGTRSSSSGDGGAISLRGSEIAIRDEALVLSLAQGPGRGGDVVLDADALVEVTGAAEVQARAEGAGRGGDLTLESDGAVDVLDRAVIFSDAQDEGRGGDVVLRAAARVTLADTAIVRSVSDADAALTGRGGDVRIEAASLDVEGGAQVSASTLGDADAGDVEILATDHVRVTGIAELGGEIQPSGVFSRSGSSNPPVDASGSGGSLFIGTPTLLVESGAEVSARTFGSGSAGDLEVAGARGEAGADPPPAELVRIDGGSNGTALLSARGADGPGGNLTVRANLLEIADGGQLSASTLARGDAGDVVVHADQISIDGFDRVSGLNPAGIFAQTNADEFIPNGGAGGSIEIHVEESLTVLEGGIISVKSVGTGQSGSIEIHGPGVIDLANGGEISALALDEGDAGDIEIANAGSVTLARGATITARSTGTAVGSGDGGSIRVAASDSIGLSDATITTEAFQGTGGDIRLTGAAAVTLSDGAEVSARAFGDGDAGSIAIEDVAQVVVDSGATITAESFGGGNAGAIAIGRPGATHVETIRLSDATIATDAFGTGTGGSMTLAATDSVKLSDGATITARSSGAESGDSGDVSVDAGRLLELSRSRITTEVNEVNPGFGGDISIQAVEQVYLLGSQITTGVGEGVGDGGDIEIDPKFVVLNSSDLIARADKGDGGDITILSDVFLASNDSVVDASSNEQNDGKIEIDTPDTDLSSQLSSLPASFLDASSLLTSHCAARTAPVGSFVVRGAGWIPPSPDGPLGGFLSEGPAAPAQISPEPKALARREPAAGAGPGACRREARVRL